MKPGRVAGEIAGEGVYGLGDAPASLISVGAKLLGTPAFDRVLASDAKRVEQESFVS